MSCGCNNTSGNQQSGQTGIPVHNSNTVIPELPQHSDDVPGDDCSKSFCDDRLDGLQSANNITLLGLVGRCMRRLGTRIRGLVIVGTDGKARVTDQIDLQLPDNQSYQRDTDGTVMTDSCTGQPLQGTPPMFPRLMGLAGGIWRFIKGMPGRRQILVWNGEAWEIDELPVFGGDRAIEDYGTINDPCGMELLGLQTINQSIPNPCGGTVVSRRVRLGRVLFPLIPIGSVMPFAGPLTNIPVGWLPCTGNTVSKTNYPDLYNVIGQSWGGSGTDFLLPDMRGEFLRGADNGRGVDPTAGRGPGSTQGYALSKHTHNSTSEQSSSPSVSFDLPIGIAGPVGEGETGVSTYAGAGTNGNDTIRANISGIGVTVTVGGVKTGAGQETVKLADETRPRNVAVNYIIYAGCRKS